MSLLGEVLFCNRDVAIGWLALNLAQRMAQYIGSGRKAAILEVIKMWGGRGLTGLPLPSACHRVFTLIQLSFLGWGCHIVYRLQEHRWDFDSIEKSIQLPC